MKKLLIVALGVAAAWSCAMLAYSLRPGLVTKASTRVRVASHDAAPQPGTMASWVAAHSSVRALSSQSLPNTQRPGARDLQLGERLRQADTLRRQIAELSRRKQAEANAAHTQLPTLGSGEKSAMPGRVGEGNQVGKPIGQYVDRLLKDQFNPVAGSCYEELLARDPVAAGSLILNVRVVGDTQVGGVVDEVEIDPASTMVDGEFRTCMRESMFAAVFDAPPGGEGEVTFSYPVQLSPDEPGRQ